MGHATSSDYILRKRLPFKSVLGLAYQSELTLSGCHKKNPDPWIEELTIQTAYIQKYSYYDDRTIFRVRAAS